MYYDSKPARMGRHHSVSWNQASTLILRAAIQLRKPTPDHGVPLFLPVHCLCLQLDDRFINSMETLSLMAQVIPLDGIMSVKNLSEVLHRRLCGTTAGVPPWIYPSRTNTLAAGDVVTLIGSKEMAPSMPR